MDRNSYIRRRRSADAEREGIRGIKGSAQLQIISSPHTVYTVYNSPEERNYDISAGLP